MCLLQRNTCDMLSSVPSELLSGWTGESDCVSFTGDAQDPLQKHTTFNKHMYYERRILCSCRSMFTFFALLTRPFNCDRHHRTSLALTVVEWTVSLSAPSWRQTVCSVKASTHRPDSNRQPAASIWPPCFLSSDPFSSKVALNTPPDVLPALQQRVRSAFERDAISRWRYMNTGNDETECTEKQSAHSILRSNTPRGGRRSNRSQQNKLHVLPNILWPVWWSFPLHVRKPWW